MNNKITLPKFICSFDKKTPNLSLPKAGIIITGNILELYRLKAIKT